MKLNFEGVQLVFAYFALINMLNFTTGSLELHVLGILGKGNCV